MTKADLVAQVAKKAGLTAKAAKDARNEKRREGSCDRFRNFYG
ncbi:MAG: hypothetical protein UR63_C0013G0028 [Candidatus Roizmanbacteria bacterium GW2011_GWC2_35_12]|uniref:Uncharacterized protein n=1 Tax=Candidatus Roizmanbacteria bacterium GW2011_GWC2_35_12 TaxID=1618485 RepID=A0A0G0BDI3_9BACT|nr:MAG: hypothetical protein UR63_C0013G0028 [Candidatus Roizmanbacteria bacterium GW2011_GWC2_35_12]